MNQRDFCQWVGCPAKRWAPYSTRFCPQHFAENAIATGQRRWARERFCGVLNGFTPTLGDVKWETRWPREDLVRVATEVLGMVLDPIIEVQWRQAIAQAAARYSVKWENSHRHVPDDYEGPGSRHALGNKRSGDLVDKQYGG